MCIRDRPCLSGLQYELSVACPHCLAECSNHREAACTQEECLHFFELKEGQRLICTKNVRDSVRRVLGMEKWLSLRRTQVKLIKCSVKWPEVIFCNVDVNHTNLHSWPLRCATSVLERVLPSIAPPQPNPPASGQSGTLKLNLRMTTHVRWPLN